MSDVKALAEKAHRITPDDRAVASFLCKNWLIASNLGFSQLPELEAELDRLFSQEETEAKLPRIETSEEE